MRNKSGVVIKGHIPFPPKPVENGQQTKMSFVDASSDKLDNRDVMPRLAPSAEPVAEHEAQRYLQHRFVGLLKASFLVKSENLMGGGQRLFGALQKAFNLRPISLFVA